MTAKIQRIHKGCGGVIKNGTCTVCRKKWGKLLDLLDVDVEYKEEKFDPKAYRKRIREGRDINEG